jgi:parvulin-like peptidyl-prolyl isomerase
MGRIGSVLVVALFTVTSAFASTPVLRVNGDEITDNDLRLAEQAIKVQLHGRQMSEETIVRLAVDRLIGRAIILQAAREAKIAVDPKDVTTAVDEQRQRRGGAEAFAKALSEAGVTEAEFAQMEREGMITQKYLETDVYNKTGVSDQEVRSYYDAHPDDFKHPEQVKLRMILIMVKEGADKTEEDAAKARAEAALKRVTGGEDFAKVAGEVSEDPRSKVQGGEIGWVHKGMLLPELESAVWPLKAGEVSAVLHSKYGYHIFKVDERRPEGTSSLDEVKDGLTRYLRNQKLNDSVRLLIMSRRAKAKIEGLNPAVKAALEPPAVAVAAPAAKPAPAEKPPAAATPKTDAHKTP